MNKEGMTNPKAPPIGLPIENSEVVISL